MQAMVCPLTLLQMESQGDGSLSTPVVSVPRCRMCVWRACLSRLEHPPAALQADPWVCRELAFWEAMVCPLGLVGCALWAPAVARAVLGDRMLLAISSSHQNCSLWLIISGLSDIGGLPSLLFLWHYLLSSETDESTDAVKSCLLAVLSHRKLMLGQKLELPPRGWCFPSRDEGML